MVTIAIVGRPNVGKSTLFNRLTKFHKAIIHNYPGITRDYKEVEGSLGDLSFKIIDTAGIYTLGKLSDFDKSINVKTESAIDQADILLFIVDGKEGFNAEDANISRFLRKKNMPVILVINKEDSKATRENAEMFFQLGHKEFCTISAEHGTGLGELYELIFKYFPEEEASQEEEEGIQKVRISILGRPNVGKSTLINAIIKKDRLLTADIPGTTRDSIMVDAKFRGYAVEIVDTAGLRKKRNIERDSIEQLFTGKTLDSVFSSDVAILMVDINNLLEYQDLKIASLIIDRGKPIILVVNKIDTIKDRTILAQIKDEFNYLINKRMSEIKTLPVIYVSALHKRNIEQILKVAVQQYELWHKKIPSSALNRWLEYVLEEHQPPMSKLGTRIKIKYINQISTSPCVFQIFVNRPTELPKRYINYLATNLRKSFDMQGIPVKIVMAKNKNPYHSEDK